MAAYQAGFFTLDKANRLETIQDVLDGGLTTQMAANRLNLSTRQCRRLITRYQESGPRGMTKPAAWKIK